MMNKCVDRYTEIERENRILLEKMTHIMQTTTNTSGLVSGPNGSAGAIIAATNHNGSVNRGSLFTPGGGGGYGNPNLAQGHQIS